MLEIYSDNGSYQQWEQWQPNTENNPAHCTAVNCPACNGILKMKSGKFLLFMNESKNDCADTGPEIG